MSTKNPAIDRALGARVRYARIAAKMSQGTLGEKLGISFQQVQKYELGKDRISASALLSIARILDREVVYFYEDVVKLGDRASEADTDLADIVDRRGRERVSASYDVKIIRLLQQLDGDVKKRITGLLEAIAAPAPVADVPAPQLQAAE